MSVCVNCAASIPEGRAPALLSLYRKHSPKPWAFPGCWQPVRIFATQKQKGTGLQVCACSTGTPAGCINWQVPTSGRPCASMKSCICSIPRWYCSRPPPCLQCCSKDSSPKVAMTSQLKLICVPAHPVRYCPEPIEHGKTLFLVFWQGFTQLRHHLGDD